MYEFTYEQLPPRNDRFSWRITDLKSWDGVKNAYGVDDPTVHQVFTYSNPCYHEYGGCYEGPGKEGFKLVGHQYTNVTTYGYEAGSQLFLGRTNYEFMVPGNGGGNPLLYGREKVRSQFADENGTTLLSSSENNWLLNDAGATCPRNAGSLTDFVCLNNATQSIYTVNGAASTISHYLKKDLTYDPGAQGGRQWGIQTRADTLYSYDNVNYTTVTRDMSWYVGNTNAADWVVMPWAQGSYDVDWNLTRLSLSLYEIGRAHV